MLDVQFQVCNKWRKNAIARAIFLCFSLCGWILPQVFFSVRLVPLLGGIGAKFDRSCHSAFHFLPSFPDIASFSFCMSNLPISEAAAPQGQGVFSFSPVSCRLWRTRRPLAFYFILPAPCRPVLPPCGQPDSSVFLLVSFLCLAVSAKSLSVSVISLSISFRLSRESRAFPSACSTCLSPMQWVRRGRVFFRFLSFHAALCEREAPWLLLLYGSAAFPFGKSGELGL